MNKAAKLAAFFFVANQWMIIFLPVLQGQDDIMLAGNAKSPVHPMCMASIGFRLRAMARA